MTKSDIEARNYSFVSVFQKDGDYRCIRFLVGTPHRRQAVSAAKRYMAQHHSHIIIGEICIYPRNYIRDARVLFDRGFHD